MIDLDDAAQRWLEIVRSEEVDEEGYPIYSFDQQERAFKAVTNWIKDRKRLFPEKESTEGANVTTMRQLLRDPSVQQELRKMFAGPAQLGGTRSALSGGLDSAAEQKRSAAGSALRALVFEGEGLEENQGGQQVS